MSSSLQMPAFLQGPFRIAQRRAAAEGRRCAARYQRDGTLPVPEDLLPVPSGEVVLAQDAVDLHRERPAWRLYLVSTVMSGLCEALDWQNAFQVRDAYEVSARQTAWGALYFVTSREAPKSAERMALRLRAVLRFWEPLLSVSYLFKTAEAPLTLEELLKDSCGWALEAWDPGGEAPMRGRLEGAAARMATATRTDSIEAILRQMPRVLPLARGLKHPVVLDDPAFWREQLEALAPAAFERVSGAYTPELLSQLHLWDRQLGVQ